MAKSDVGRFRDLVYRKLHEHPNLRDNVTLLYIACISDIRGKDYVRNKTIYDFAIDISVTSPLKDLPKLPSILSVCRLNTKLQKEHPDLRGKDWEKKQKHSKDYKEDLGYGR